MNASSEVVTPVPDGAAVGPVEVRTSAGTGASSGVFHLSPPLYGSGRALALDGQGDYLSVGSNDFFYIQGAKTITLWAKRAPDASAPSPRSKRAAVAGPALNVRAASGAGPAAGAAAEADTLWHHWAIVYTSPEKPVVYRDGVAVSPEPGNAQFPMEAIPTPSAFADFGPPIFAGKIDEFRFWSTTRTPEQIRGAMHRTLTGSEPGLLAYYRFDEDDDARAYDYAGTSEAILQGNPQRVPSGAALGQADQEIATTGSTGALGQSGAQVSATLSTTSGPDDRITLYTYGAPDAPAVPDTSLPDPLNRRAALVWGVEETGDVEVDLTFSYGQIQNLNLADVRLLKREAPDRPWQDVTAQFIQDEQAQTFSKRGVSSFSEFALAEAGQPLPVELTGFAAAADGAGQVCLSWQTVSEARNARFEVQRRTALLANANADEGPGKSGWAPVARVQSKAPGGTSAESLSYTATDATLPFEVQTLTYRLVQVDLDGTRTVAGEQTIEIGTPAAFALHGSIPNPMRTQTTIRYELLLVR